MRKYVIIFLFSLPLTGFAQDILQQELQWQSGQTRRTDNNQQFGLSCKFITRSTSIDWIQKNGAKVITYDVLGNDGTWTDTSTNGQCKFLVKTGDLSGSLLFERTASGIRVTMDFPSGGKNTMPYQFLIDNISLN